MKDKLIEAIYVADPIKNPWDGRQANMGVFGERFNTIAWNIAVGVWGVLIVVAGVLLALALVRARNARRAGQDEKFLANKSEVWWALLVVGCLLGLGVIISILAGVVQAVSS